MGSSPTEKLYFNEKEVVAITGLGLGRLRNDRFHGKGLPYCKIGKSVRYSINDITEYMESHKVELSD